MLKRDVPPICKSISSEAAADAVSVAFILIAVNVVPPAFHVSVRSKMFIVDMGLPSYNLGAIARYYQSAGACEDFFCWRCGSVEPASASIPASAAV
jgi:hypothetical protein